MAADISTFADCWNDDILAALPPPPAAAAADGNGSGIDGYDYDDDDDDGDAGDGDSGDDGDFDDGIPDDEDANVAAAPGTVEDGREPLSLIRAPHPLRDLLALLFLPK